MVSFEQFWRRLRNEFSKLPGPEPRVHVGTTRKWSEHSGNLRSSFAFLYKGGNVIYCETETTKKLRTISKAELQKVYGVWPDYLERRIGRSYIVRDLGVQNTSWIIPIPHEYENLMK